MSARSGRPGTSPPLAPAGRVDVLGVGISCVDLDRSVEIIGRWIDDSAREYVCVTGMHGVMESRADPELRAIHNQSGLTTPDGMPMVWAGRRAGASISRVYGPDLMHAVFAAAQRAGWSSYLVGGAPGVADQLMARMDQQYPGLRWAGAQSPPYRALREPETQALLRDINHAQPDLIWVGLGTPKQERWMAAHRHELDAPVLVGVGAAFDILAGTLRQAPRWMQRSGLEWAYRLAVEPRRLWRRYLVNIPRFALAILRHPPRPWPAPAPDRDA
jgi:N-acetylglucosaminyldiphosphoundecaprenol N-acetyl-beta-D-mannosaminyltransferase